MATNRDEKLLALTRKQNRVIDAAVGELRGSIERALAKALPQVQSWLSDRLTVVADLVEPSRQTQATLRLLYRQITTQTLLRGKLGQQIEDWSHTFGRQMPLFDETLRLMGLPKLDWKQSDKNWLANSILSGQEQVRGVIENAARTVQEQALYSYGSLKLSRLYELMQSRMALAPAAAVNVADTSATVFLRSVHERGYARIEETQGSPLRYRFYGPDDKLERTFCHALHQGKAIDRTEGKRHIFAPASTAPDGSYTREEIARMSNGQLPNVMLTGGGYRCRHQWIVASLAPAVAKTDEPKPRPAVPVPPPDVPKIWDAGVANTRFRAVAGARELTERQYAHAVENHAKELLDESAVFVRMRPGGLDGILENGRFKNQLETGTSAGALDADLRRRIDRRLFGVADSAAPEEHPVYGFLSDDLDGATAGRSGLVHAYGRIAARLKASVRERATFTDGDSLNYNRPWNDGVSSVPAPVNAPSARSFRYLSDPLKARTVREIATDYVEAQVFGGLTIDDVEAIVFDRQEDLDRFRARLEERGIKVLLANPRR